jgi:hypothetical protein
MNLLPSIIDEDDNFDLQLESVVAQNDLGASDMAWTQHQFRLFINDIDAHSDQNEGWNIKSNSFMIIAMSSPTSYEDFDGNHEYWNEPQQLYGSAYSTSH